MDKPEEKLQSPEQQAELFRSRLKIFPYEKEKVIQKAKEGHVVTLIILFDYTIVASPEQLHHADFDMHGINPEEIVTEGRYLFKYDSIVIDHRMNLARRFNFSPNIIDFCIKAIKEKIREFIEQHET